MEYEVDPADVDQAASQVMATAARLGRVRPDVAVRVVGLAVPGGEVAASSARLTAAWQARMEGARRELRACALALGETSAGYGTLEAGLAHGMASARAGAA